MASKSMSTSTQTDPMLLSVLDELIRWEPIFHMPDFGMSAEEYEVAMAPDYWEVGASGQCYSRDFILETLRHRKVSSADELGWVASEHALRWLGSETYLITYLLRQGERVTRRATIWQKSRGHWCILYHQGTVVSADESQTLLKLEEHTAESGPSDG